MAFRQRTFLGHPIGLYVLFFTEMWERFSYYGMRALLILYMVNYLKMTQKEASTIYKVYTSFVYITPIIGGFLADRLLGNRKAVIIGAILMAIGHFLMAFEDYPIFMSALIFLIIGNGFFKPNMSTQVGRLYPTNDGRRDGAYTIFYMGINLGAFLSPLACGWLQENTVGEYHSGFTLAGIGMVCGLVIYLLGQPLLREIEPGSADDKPVVVSDAPVVESRAISEDQAEQTPSVVGALNRVAPMLIQGMGILLLLAAPATFLVAKYRGSMGLPGWLPGLELWDAVMLGIAGICGVLIAWVCAKVKNAVRDRVLAILALGVFVVFFWGAAEQAGNVFNIWADKNTQRYLTKEAPSPDVIPVVENDIAKPAAGVAQAAPPQHGITERFRTMFDLKKKKPAEKEKEFWEGMSETVNPVPTAWFQSINSLAIIIIAPVFAWLWVLLDRRHLQPSIPLKMAIGLVFMSLSTMVMYGAASQENKASKVSLKGAKLPVGIELHNGDQIGNRDEHYSAGRLTFDDSTKSLHLLGVLPDTERDRMIRETAPADYAKSLVELQKKSEAIDDKHTDPVSVTLTSVPTGFDMRYSGLKKSKVTFDESAKTLTAYDKLVDKDTKALLKAGGDPQWRDTINELFVASSKFQVSWQWLFWSYILLTLGELCLSPVGLSMVSKLAPRKYATLLMGMWMLTSAFGNFAAGLLGEQWGNYPPIPFFLVIAVIVGISAIVLFILVRKIVATMHGVN